MLVFELNSIHTKIYNTLENVIKSSYVVFELQRSVTKWYLDFIGIDKFKTMKQCKRAYTFIVRRYGILPYYMKQECCYPVLIVISSIYIEILL